ncbi:MAG: hypothetical protein Q4C00_08585 [Bacillota bacterium]|nr:hypothetical protein [Bacillota bacterium]
MILYAIRDKISQKYWRKRENSIELLTLDHCSVFKERKMAEDIAYVYGTGETELIEINLDMKVIPW